MVDYICSGEAIFSWGTRLVPFQQSRKASSWQRFRFLRSTLCVTSFRMTKPSSYSLFPVSYSLFAVATPPHEQSYDVTAVPAKWIRFLLAKVLNWLRKTSTTKTKKRTPSGFLWVPEGGRTLNIFSHSEALCH